MKKPIKKKPTLKKSMKKRIARNKAARRKIEMQETIKEVKIKSFQKVRLSRIKYEGNDYHFIDVRIFQRGYDDNADEAYYPTRLGVQLREDLFFKLVDQNYIAMLDRQIKQSEK